MKMDYIPKSKGYTYIKYQLAKARRNKVQKHITMHIEKAEELIKELDSPKKTVVLPYKVNSPSVKAAALCLCIGVRELCDILNANIKQQ